MNTLDQFTPWVLEHIKKHREAGAMELPAISLSRATLEALSLDMAARFDLYASNPRDMSVAANGQVGTFLGCPLLMVEFEHDATWTPSHAGAPEMLSGAPGHGVYR